MKRWNDSINKKLSSLIKRYEKSLFQGNIAEAENLLRQIKNFEVERLQKGVSSYRKRTIHI